MSLPRFCWQLSSWYEVGLEEKELGPEWAVNQGFSPTQCPVLSYWGWVVFAGAEALWDRSLLAPFPLIVCSPLSHHWHHHTKKEKCWNKRAWCRCMVESGHGVLWPGTVRAWDHFWSTGSGSTSNVCLCPTQMLLWAWISQLFVSLKLSCPLGHRSTQLSVELCHQARRAGAGPLAPAEMLTHIGCGKSVSFLFGSDLLSWPCFGSKQHVCVPHESQLWHPSC